MHSTMIIWLQNSFGSYATVNFSLFLYTNFRIIINKDAFFLDIHELKFDESEISNAEKLYYLWYVNCML